MGLYKGSQLISPVELVNGGGSSDDTYEKFLNGSLTSTVIPNSVTTIRNYTFSNISSLQSVTLNNNITSIGTEAFSGTNITNLSIPSSVTSIGENAFANCTNLSTIYIDKNTDTISGAPWGATNAKISWKDSLNGKIDLTDYSFSIENDNIIINGYNGSDTELVLPNVI